jgi:hypothetical protein
VRKRPITVAQQQHTFPKSQPSLHVPVPEWFTVGLQALRDSRGMTVYRAAIADSIAVEWNTLISKVGFYDSCLSQQVSELPRVLSSTVLHTKTTIATVF